MKAEVLTYSRARGVFAGIDLNGSRIAQDKDETRILFGKMVPFADILGGKVEAPSGSQPFLSAVKKYTALTQTGSVTEPAPATQSAQ
jgi:SH3 domain-containing YSC84-like protein 1